MGLLLWLLMIVALLGLHRNIVTRCGGKGRGQRKRRLSYGRR